jgi:hypothetical protein
MADPPPVRDPRPPPPWSPAVNYRDELWDGRVRIDRLRVHHLDLVKRFLGVADRSLYAIDLVLGADMTRSYSLVDGFITAFDGRKPIVAAQLIRMQIDSPTRVAYMATADSAETVAEYVLKGGEFRKLKDASANALTDRRLLELAAPTHPWLDDVCSATSGWVHSSPEHVRAAWQAREDEEGLRLTGAIPLRPGANPVVGPARAARRDDQGDRRTLRSCRDLGVAEGFATRTRARPGLRLLGESQPTEPDITDRLNVRPPITRCYVTGALATDEALADMSRSR